MIKRRRGWGSLLAIALPLLLWFVWAQLGSQTARLSLDRFNDWSTRDMPSVSIPLKQFYLKNKRPAAMGDVTLPEVPKNSGIKSWSIEADTRVLINLDAKINGRIVQLQLVPIVNSPNSIDYDCVSETSPIYVNNFCRASVVLSLDRIPAQLAENTRVVSNFPDVVTASGNKLAPGTPVGSVLVVPSDIADLDHCGYQCVKVQNCKKSRPLACSKTMTEGNSRWYEITATNILVRGDEIATLADADKICEQAIGAGSKVVTGSHITGSIKLGVNAEYWVHDDIVAHNNCWRRN
ncbi:MAG: hypothetical protein V4660_09980 [Pseudomonadota bacterium]